MYRYFGEDWNEKFIGSRVLTMKPGYIASR